MTDGVVGGLLRAQAARMADRPFLTCGETSYTWAEADGRASRVAAGFARLGIGKGDRVALLSPNRVEMLELYFGLARLGAVQVPLNAYLKGEFLRYQLDDSEATALVVDAAGWRAVEPLLAGLPALRHVVVLDAPEALDAVPYADLLAGDEPWHDVELAPSDLMSIVYTSGTTGFPKGCMLTHGYYLRVGRVLVQACEMSEHDVLLTALPLFHGAARMMVVAAGLVRGIPVIVEPTFSPSSYLSRAAEVGATLAFGVGAMGMALLSTPPSPADRAHRLRAMMLVPFPPAHQPTFAARFGIDPWPGVFGQTECVPVTWSGLSEERRPESCGIGARDLEVALLDDDDRPVAVGEVGEICLRPREPFAMFEGYWRKPEATVAAFRNLWYHTGDFGRQDADGFVSFVDRKKDAVRRRGENVSTLELEAAICRHDSVAEAAVHAVPSDATEDDIKACLVLQPDAEVEPKALFDFFAQTLPYFAIPRYVEILPELPKNAMSRVMKFQLRERGLGPDVWDFELLGYTVDKAARR